MFLSSNKSLCRRLIDEGYGQPCVLNFADAFEPGGLFLQGVTTQEERLARCTGLFWCIKDQAYYTRNLERMWTHPLYLQDLLYSADVPVFRDLTTEKRMGNALLDSLFFLFHPSALWQMRGRHTLFRLSPVQHLRRRSLGSMICCIRSRRR